MIGRDTDHEIMGAVWFGVLVGAVAAICYLVYQAISVFLSVIAP